MNSVVAMLNRVIVALVAPLLLAACATVPATAPEPFTKGMVSAADPRAAGAGAEMLRKGGSATDAAIATMLALTVVDRKVRASAGADSTSTPHPMARSTRSTAAAPKGASPQWLLATDGRPLPFRDAVLSGLSIGVPGNIALAAEAHRQHGRLPWAELQPAIRLARDGWVVTDRFRGFLLRSPSSAARNRSARRCSTARTASRLPQERQCAIRSWPKR